jgi:hypothetical protein
VTNRTGEVAALLGDSACYYPERDMNALADQCETALGQWRSFDNRIAFSSLTWEARAKTFAQWLEERGWSSRPKAQQPVAPGKV